MLRSALLQVTSNTLLIIEYGNQMNTVLQEEIEKNEAVCRRISES